MKVTLTVAGPAGCGKGILLSKLEKILEEDGFKRIGRHFGYSFDGVPEEVVELIREPSKEKPAPGGAG